VTVDCTEDDVSQKGYVRFLVRGWDRLRYYRASSGMEWSSEPKATKKNR
jgi:hypothetical protein